MTGPYGENPARHTAVGAGGRSDDDFDGVQLSSAAAAQSVTLWGKQVAKVYRYQLGTSRADAKRRALEMFERVKLPSPRTMYGKYAYELSGGCDRGL